MKVLVGGNYSLFCDSISYIMAVKATNNTTNKEEFIVVAVLKGNQGPINFDNPNVISLTQGAFETMEQALYCKSLITRFLNESNYVYLDEVEDNVKNKYNNRQGGKYENIVR